MILGSLYNVLTYAFTYFLTDVFVQSELRFTLGCKHLVYETLTDQKWNFFRQWMHFLMSNPQTYSQAHPSCDTTCNQRMNDEWQYVSVCVHSPACVLGASGNGICSSRTLSAFLTCSMRQQQQLEIQAAIVLTAKGCITAAWGWKYRLHNGYSLQSTIDQDMFRKLALPGFPRGIWASPNSWFLGPTRVHIQKASQLVQPF